MEIPPWIFVLVGVVVAVSSYFIKGLEVFTYVGIAMLAFGAVKWYILGKPKKQEQLRQIYPRFAYCRQCRSASPLGANFCGKCGYRL